MAEDIPLPISFGSDDKAEASKEKVSRGATEIATHNLNQNQFGAPKVGGFQKQQVRTSQLSQTGDLKPTFGAKYPLQIITLELDDAPKQKQAAPVISVKDAADAQSATPEKAQARYTNDLSSYAVKDQTPAQVLSGLTAVLVSYSQDMDIKLDEARNTIEGVVFVENYYGIKFRMNIWSEDAKTTRFELERTSGDAMATAKFLGDIKTKFFIDIEDTTDKDKADEKEPEFNLVSLSLDATSLDLKELFRQISTNDLNLTELKEEEDSISQKELDEVNESLVKNYQESVDELQFLHERLKENGAISKDIISHEQLVKTIIGEAMKNKDICVVRGCLLILEQLCSEEKIGLLLVEQYSLFENLATLLNHEYGLIKNYSVRLLAKLSSQKKWNMNKEAADKITKLVKEYQNEWKNSILANNGFLNATMFDSIYKKLAECQ